MILKRKPSAVQFSSHYRAAWNKKKGGVSSTNRDSSQTTVVNAKGYGFGVERSKFKSTAYSQMCNLMTRASHETVNKKGLSLSSERGQKSAKKLICGCPCAQRRAIFGSLAQSAQQILLFEIIYFIYIYILGLDNQQHPLDPSPFQTSPPKTHCLQAALQRGQYCTSGNQFFFKKGISIRPAC